MGSHLTNDDLVKNDRLADDFNATQTFSGARDNEQIFELTLTPKAKAKTVWGKIVLALRQSDQLPVHEQFFDESGHLVRTVSYLEYKTLGGKTVPTLLRVLPAGKPSEQTELRYDELQFDVQLGDSFFSLHELQK
jgi:hypothetical protein